MVFNPGGKSNSRTRMLVRTAPTSFPTNPCRSCLQSEAPSAQNSHSCARCAMMAIRVEKTATSTTTRGEWKREVQTTQQQEAKRLGIKSCFPGGWETSERLPTHGAALGKHECLLGLVEHWPHFPTRTASRVWRKLGAANQLVERDCHLRGLGSLGDTFSDRFPSRHGKHNFTEDLLALHHTSNGL